jgi:hypothetical protein
VGAEALVARPGGVDIEALKGPAAALWLLLEHPTPVEELELSLARLFDTEVAAIRTDVASMVGDLVARGWLTEEAAG